LLQVAHLTKRYGQLAALSDVSFSIRPGEVLGLIGPNGSGKTTLFECLGGVLPADGGAVLAGSRALTPSEQKAAVFYLPDAIAPWPSQTVRWAIGFVTGYWGQIRGLTPNLTPGLTPDLTPDLTPGLTPDLTPGLTPPTAAEVVSKLGLEPLLDKRISALSKGQRKRALLAFGLLTPQPVLLADEPFEGLDLRQTREVAEALRDYAAGGRTLVLSIHQITDAARVCDRFVLLSGGRICGEGTHDDLRFLAGQKHLREHSDPARPQAAPDTLEEIFLALT
jgi:ABC-2 type transport system ATP-binding protein